jgi:hypothetical protein
MDVRFIEVHFLLDPNKMSNKEHIRVSGLQSTVVLLLSRLDYTILANCGEKWHKW